MNTPEVTDAINKVSSQVLEDMAFVFAEPAETDLPWEDSLIKAELSFSGEHQGKLILVMGSSLCLELAANLLGIELDDPEAGDKSFDALGELTNVIGGILMKEVFGENQKYTIGIPEVKAVTPDDLPEQSENCDCVFLMDDEERRFDVAMQWG